MTPTVTCPQCGTKHWGNYSSRLCRMCFTGVLKTIPRFDPPLTEVGGVYLIQADRWYKIGCTENIWRRLKEIDQHLPVNATLVHFLPCGNYLHIELWLKNIMSAKHIKNEWYDLNEEDVKFIKDISVFTTRGDTDSDF